MTTNASYDVVIIGAGHNGLTCAAYLARAGRRVLVLEAADRVGGAAVTREIAPGCSVSACAHVLNQLQGHVVRELGLERHGLRLAGQPLDTIALSESGPHLRISGSAITAGDLPAADRAALPVFRERMLRYARVLAPALAKAPPRLANGRWTDWMALSRLGLGVRSLGRDEMREFLRIAGINIYDVLQEIFTDDLLKGAVALDAVLGTHMGPRSPNTVLSYLYRLTGESAGVQGAVSLPAGGMGTVTQALASAATSYGATIRTRSIVTRVMLEHDAVAGVELDDGEVIRARTIVSNADPKTTLLDLVGAMNLETGFARRIDQIRMRGSAAKLNLALDGLPSFRGLDADALGQRLLIAPSLTYLEHAFNHSKYGEYSGAPALEIVLPSVRDPSLVSGGRHVLSAVVQYAPYQLKAGWDGGREAFLKVVLDRLEIFAPDLRQRIVATQFLVPPDIEREFRITGGHWHHGELALDQFLMVRPVPGTAQYATPIPGLYLCGAGAHPGGGVMGAAGRSAAHAVIARGAAA